MSKQYSQKNLQYIISEIYLYRWGVAKAINVVNSSP